MADSFTSLHFVIPVHITYNETYANVICYIINLQVIYDRHFVQTGAFNYPKPCYSQ